MKKQAQSKHCFHYGIVLRSYAPYQQKLVLLDRSCGMIDAFFFQRKMMGRITHGMLLRYTLREERGRHRLDDIVVLACPVAWVKDDIFFLHHVLELAHNFLSYHQAVGEVFDLFMRLYKPLSVTKNSFFKKCFLCKFFLLLGIYPNDETLFSSELFHLISGCIDTMVKSQSDFLDDAKISHWLQGCIAVHPAADCFKTTIFLTQMDNHEV